MPKITFQCLLVILTAFTNFPAWASLPPPLTNQHPGISISELEKMTSIDCLKCHGNPANAVVPADSSYLPDRHHLRVDTPIAEHSASPYPEKSPDGKHKCVTCHLLNWTQDFSKPSGGSFQFTPEPTEADFRNCLHCHTLNINPNSKLSSASHQHKQQNEVSYKNAAPYPDNSSAPDINEINEASITIDSATPLIILGSGFIDDSVTSSNIKGSPNHSWARLTGINGTIIDLSPIYVSPTHMEVLLSTTAGLEPGSYQLTVIKQGNYSKNILSSTPVHLTIKPKVTIDAIDCDNNTITIYGSGFNSYLNAEHSNTAVHAGINGEKCAVNTWTENKIIANCNTGIGKQVRVASLFGDTTTKADCVTLVSSDNENRVQIWKWWSSWSWSRR